MSDAVVGLIALVAGLFLCFLGRSAVRVILSVWGAFVGFALGGALVSALTGSSPFATWVGWLVGIVLALLMAGLAHAFYALAVAITMGSIGYGFGAALAIGLGSDPTLVHVVGVAAAVVLAVVALVTNLPDALLVVLTALAGAGAIVVGLMLVTGAAEAADFAVSDVRTVITQQRWWWAAMYAMLAATGVVSQSRSSRTQPMKAGWGA
ncbi:TM7S3/TM198-like domain-containing protein [Tessaracoccus antarcticus]|nr:DUF4203 domain-containing protein [Tessaracoccus antarcticus]